MKNNNLIYGATAMFLGICTVVALCKNPNTHNRAAKTDVLQELPPAAGPVDIDALYVAYENNEVRADEIYKGAFIRITGRVEEVGKDFTGRPFVELKMGRYQANGVHCIFDNAAGLSQLNKGINATIEGVCTGKMMGDVILSRCRLK